MIIRDIVRKLAQGAPLNSMEQGYLNRLDSAVNQVGSMTIPGTTGMSLSAPSISNPNFTTSPLSLLKLNFTTDTAIANNTDTFIGFESGRNDGHCFSWEVADPTKVRLQYLGKSFLVHVVVAWAANGTGYRNAKVHGFDKDDVSLGNGVILNLPGANLGDDVYNGLITIGENDIPNMAYFKVSVAQGSGGNLTLKYVDASVFII